MSGHLSQEASFLRTALLLGLIPGSAVVRWAEEAIEKLESPPYPLSDIVSIHSEDITALRYALLDLCSEEISETVLHGIIGLIRRDLDTGTRTVHDAVMVLSQLRRFNRLDRAVYDELLEWEFGFSNVRNEEDIFSFGAKLREWLSRFRSSEMDVLSSLR